MPGPVEEIAVNPRPAKELLVCAERPGQSDVPIPAAAAAGPGRIRPEERNRPGSPLRDLLRLDPELADPRDRARSCRRPGKDRRWSSASTATRHATGVRRRSSCRNWRGVVMRSRWSIPAAWASRGPLASPRTRLRRPAGRRGGEHRLQRLPGGQVAAGDACHRRAGRRAEAARAEGSRGAWSCAAGAMRPWSPAWPPRWSRRSRTWRPRRCCSASGRCFTARGTPINAASILPGLLERFGDVPDVLAEIAPRKILIAAGVDEGPRTSPSARTVRGRFTGDPRLFTDWLDD